MRIVGGKLKGRTLASFSGKEVRPTSDQTRESLFNILQFKIADKSFLDLFCGTGAVGIEAYSRGARRVVLNDASKESVKLAKSNLVKLGVGEIEVFNYDALRFLETATEKFDYVFIDAPYALGVGERAVQKAADVLAPLGEIIYEHEKPLTGSFDGLVISDERKYGRARLTFFKKDYE